MSDRQILWLIIIVLALAFLCLLMLFIKRFNNKRRLRSQKEAEQRIIAFLNDSQSSMDQIRSIDLINAFVKLNKEIKLDQETLRRIDKAFADSGLCKKAIRSLRSFSTIKRKQASSILSAFDSVDIRKALVEALKKEKSEHVKIYFLNALKNKIDQQVLQAIIDSILGSKRYYQIRIIGILKQHLLSVEAHLQNIFRRPEMEIKEVFVDLTNVYYRPEFKPILLDELRTIEAFLDGSPNETFSKEKKSRVTRLYYQVLRALANVYDTPLNKPEYLASQNPEIVKIATDSFLNVGSMSSIKTILEYADGSDLDLHRAQVITKILEKNQALYAEVIKLIQSQISADQRTLLAQVISHRIDYLMLKLMNSDKRLLKQMIALMVEKGHTADLIEFINQNRVGEMSDLLLQIIKPLANQHPKFRDELGLYAFDDVLTVLDIQRYKPEPAKKSAPIPEIRKTRWLLRILIISLVFLPVLFVLTHIPSLIENTDYDNFTTYIVFINKFFIGYYLAVNFVYLIVALLSFFRARKQLKLYRLKNKGFLFENMMLPSISIIAPAFNEELSIVESVNSLLNLDYPEFEVIVVNDGSKDKTLRQLIEHFQLERKNVSYVSAIETKAVKAVYQNPYLPSLLVVDKENGGKADALNVGINFSKCEYICGIDADSLLEKDALLSLMSSMLDHDKITIALGGNIVPVNGYTIDMGNIESKQLPKSLLARLQTIEYLRAFNISRGGFAGLGSLLIVSGAFGLFEKRILSEVGGYLTESSLKKGTVGEDMELVVRITRKALEQKLRFRVDYIGNARCYTEVPENRKSFFKQRNRWQRGLVDILSYHRRMIFNPGYKSPGLIGMGYYFIFEMVGPLFELQAYLAVMLGLILGILSVEIILLLLLVTMVMGIFMSALSLMISEEDVTSLSAKDVFKLMLMAIVENFGWRQLISLFRVKGFLSSLRETNAWGEMNRVGFASTKPPSK